MTSEMSMSVVGGGGQGGGILAGKSSAAQLCFSQVLVLIRWLC